MKRILFCFILLFANSAFSQQAKSYDYLIGCFKNAITESDEIEIDKIGRVKPTSLNSEETGDIGLFYYDVPEDKVSLSASKLAELAGNFHIDTWKNNSKVIKKKEQKIGSTVILDLRFHMLIEDIYMQVITISENKKIYQVISFSDTDVYENAFDSTLKKVVKKDCF